MRFLRFIVIFIICTLFFTSCKNNPDVLVPPDSETGNIDTAIQTDTDSETDALTEDLTEDTDAKDVFIMFDPDEYKQLISEIYSRPAPTGATAITNINDLAFLCTLSAVRGDVGPIGIVPAKLESDGVIEDVYLITLGGTEFKDGQATDIQTDVLAGFGKSNDYLRAVVDTVNAQIPKNSKLFIAGLSLGGMVAQQVASEPEICNNYEIVNTMCIGSPLVINEKSNLREGKILRFEDSFDFVPKASIYTFNLSVMSKYSHERISEKSDYIQPIYAHTFSYVSSPVWKKYDAAGIENGNSTLRFNADNITYYNAPIINQ